MSCAVYSGASKVGWCVLVFVSKLSVDIERVVCWEVKADGIFSETQVMCACL